MFFVYQSHLLDVQNAQKNGMMKFIISRVIPTDLILESTKAKAQPHCDVYRLDIALYLQASYLLFLLSEHGL